MKPTNLPSVYKQQDKLYTSVTKKSKKIKVYNEKIIQKNGKYFRSWNPYRSKLSAALLKNLDLELKPEYRVLYLGAATGTTVSHISDIVKNGLVYAVENSPLAAKKLLKVCENRSNIIPILKDANHPHMYKSVVPSTVDLVYQDIAQRNQAEIFISNVKTYLKNNGFGVLMVKARSIDVSMKPKKAYNIVCSKLKENDLKVNAKLDLKPFEKDHACILIQN
ncbi:MAG: fibrillarin-like rRNA/tRNA 2'-O-methyltransferase [Candidatus Thermoplasmatota archaeon]